MVKEKKNEVREYCIDPKFPCAREYNDRDQFELVTEPDMSPSLHQMVITGTVGSMPGNSSAYVYPDLGDDDDEAHNHPDYEKLDRMDIVEKENYVENFLNDERNYEKPEKQSDGVDLLNPEKSQAAAEQAAD